MKNGYYLSTYMHIDELAHLMGIRKRHDQSVSLWEKKEDKLELIHYWELERVTGVKKQPVSFYDVHHAQETINLLLKPHHLTLDDMVEVWGTPELQTVDDYHSIDDYPQLSYHSIAHLFSAVMMDTEIFQNNTMVGFAVDGGPDGVLDPNEMKKFFYAGCVAQNGRIVDVFPVYSPGPLWFFASLLYNLREGTLMALGSASESQLYQVSDDLILIDDMDSLVKLFDFVKSLKAKVDLLEEKDQGLVFNGFDPRFTKEENRISMVMKVIHSMSLRIMEINVDNVLKKYNLDPKETYLALAGGYALNCPTNSYLMEKYGFRDFIAPPCVSDSGLSLGMALYGFYKKMGRFHFKLQSASYGDKDLSLPELLAEGKYRDFIKEVSELRPEKVVSDIMEAPLVWFDGCAEIGPRALGNRSIIADSRLESSKDELNIIKKRQWWRPVAPIVLEEEVGAWFENAYPSPFMLHTFEVKKEKLHSVPAISHLDQSARVQTIDSRTNQRLYHVVKAFQEKTGVPVICNTSLNDAGEPIINSIEEAVNFILRKKVKVAYINGQRIEFCNHENYRESQPLSRKIAFFRFTEAEKAELLKKLNPHNVPGEVLQLYYDSDLKSQYDLTDANDARKLVISAKYVLKNAGVNIALHF